MIEFTCFKSGRIFRNKKDLEKLQVTHYSDGSAELTDPCPLKLCEDCFIEELEKTFDIKGVER